MAEGLLSLSWNNHSSTFCHMLSSLRDMERYTDVTIACEGKFYSAHKLVLSTCSDYFLKMFERTPCKHPIIVVKDVECKDIEALLSYMYAGVVSVAQNDLTQLIKAAELLQIKGLAVPDEPPITSKKAAHVRSSTDDRSSPHPKRQRREENRSPSRSEGQSLRSNAPSPRSSPFSSKDSEYSQEQVATNRHHSKANQRIEQKQDQKLERRGDRTSTEQQSEQHTDQEVEQRVECRPVTKESPEAEAEVVDESVIKEEMVEGESEGELPESGFDYRALVSNLGVDGCGMTKDHSNPLSSPYNHPPDDQSFDSQAGPSGLQGWANLGESGETSSQGYCGDLNQELSMQVHPGPQHQQAHHLMQLNREEQTAEGAAATGDEEGFTSVSELHHCPFCPYNTSKSLMLKKHIQTHCLDNAYSLSQLMLIDDKTRYRAACAAAPSRGKQYSCSICPFTASEKCGLKVHMRTHTGERPFACPHCPSKFTQNVHLKDHLHIHTGEKPYTCPHCPFRCANNSSIRRHIKTHTGERPYKCEFCSLCFIRLCQLKQHTLTHAKS
ncbi:B-cell CLL/lymphoma 6 member B protein isoform X2 [Procambarus clarkii]|uniref:B-cell CLL/lymphoma 6 member B protein isoform X2 n=1 Tax=Procambarus clarkii TaxID=6728 RepID=UPI001E6737DF|nr:zinc finger protein 135-like isoform X2 [Procambarus clarkii]